MSQILFNERPLIITDLETTGLDPAKNDIIEIGALSVSPKTLDVIDTFEVKVQMERPWNATSFALELNGYNPAEWENAVTLQQAMKVFAAFAATGVLLAQNVTFEYGFLREAFRKTGIADSMDYHRLDLPSMVWFMNPYAESLKLTNTAISFGLGPEPTPHRAINGAKFALEVLRKLRQLKEGY